MQSVDGTVQLHFVIVIGVTFILSILFISVRLGQITASPLCLMQLIAPETISSKMMRKQNIHHFCFYYYNPSILFSN